MWCRIFISSVCFLCLAVSSDQRSTPEDDSYVGAVVEFEVSADVVQNLAGYVQLIAQAADQNADIIVFPEMTLTRGERKVDVPIYDLLKQQPIPALQPTSYDEILVTISAAARQHQIYVLINVQEVMNCTSIPEDSEEYCPEKKEYLFNTNVIFDRTGAVIDRYRKINLFGEFTRTPALHPDLGIFSTDFGVTFGHYICFDLMFQVPAIQVVEKYKITDVLFSTMWFSEMPYLTAVQIQEAYAYAQNVNFLGAGANNVRVGSAGSGIYSGKAGALVSIMPGLPTTRLLVSRVPKVPGNVTGMTFPGPIYDPPTDHDSLVLITDPSLADHASRLLVPGFQEFTLVDKEVSCTFRVRLTPRAGDGSHLYRAFVQDGSNTYTRRQLGVASCLLVACRDEDPKICAYRFNKNETDVEITELQIDMSTIRKQYNKTLQCNNVVYFPSSFRINKFPLSSSNFTYIDSTDDENEVQPDKKTGREKITYKINTPQKELMSFGIWGRVYVKDVDHSTEVNDEDVQNYLKIEDVIYGTDRVKD
ncbi:vanin-like protein 2 isoform X1 [Cydia amplana]|uniref:vanin-like protein 2 isoform X1 n=1 Tax=Cydia amplana TaxID=1869771 RepID=UPI002FE54B3C